MNIVDALEHIEAAAQGNARLEALKKADEHCGDLRRLLFLTLSPDVTFGVKKLPAGDKKKIGFKSEYEFEHCLFQMLGKLRERELTGNDAQEHISNFLSDCDNLQRKWTERILRQDLRLNIGAKDVNKVLGKNTIYLFEVPLATDYTKVKEKDMKGRMAIQPKLDGGRCVAILPSNGGPVMLKSRTGKEWPNFESIRTALQQYNDDRGKRNPTGRTLYLDGEVVSYVNGRIDFQSIQKTMMRKDGIEVGTLGFIVFDAAVEDEWKSPRQAYSDRLKFANFAVGKIQSPLVTLIPSDVLENPTHEQLKECCKAFVEMGYEGGIARQLDKPVLNKRSKDLLKIKTFKDDEAEITGTVELQREGKGAGTLGAIGCKTKAGVAFEIGTGLTADQRAELWAMRDRLPGKFANYKFFELTNDGVPRLPVFRSLRSEDDIGKEEDDE